MFSSRRAPSSVRLPLAALAVLALLGAAVLGAVRPAYADTGCVVNSLLDTDSSNGAQCQTTAISGITTLRSAFHRNVTAGGTNTITFASTLTLPGTITLANSEMHLTAGTLTITGPGANLLSIDAHSASRIFNEGAGAVLTLSGLTLKNGTATAGVGGGAIATSGDLNVDKSEFVGNTTADFWGGAIIGNPAPTITITNSAFKTNSATAHGGGAFYNGGATTLTNDTFSGNTAGWGGAIQQSTLAMTVTNTTISGNSSSSVTYHGGGGLIDGGGTLTFKNSIVSGNSAASGGANCAIGSPPGTLVDGGYNIENGTSCGFTIGNHSLNADPLLRALANYGGPTDTMALQPGSPAKDSAGPGCPANDQRGQPRNTDGQCDRGAYEFVLPVVSSVSAATATCVTPGQSVTVNGIGFTFATSVTFGTTAATSFTVNSDSKITAVAPAGSGISDITVTSADGTSATTSADQVGLGACPTTPAPPPALPKAGHGSAPALGAAWLVIALGVLALATGFGVARHAGGNRS